jgi:short-subunit dehydrogenase
MADRRPFAVVTGASSGIGRELARQFASHGFDILITAEAGDLDAAAGDLATHGTVVREVVADLATADGAERVAAAIDAIGRPVDALALNAGIGSGGAFTATPLADQQRLIGVNVAAPVGLAQHVVPDMVRRRTGRVLFTSSAPGPYGATYTASQAFIQSFADALRAELAGTGVTVTTLLPGPTDTEFFRRAGLADPAPKDDPATVAEAAYQALMTGQSQVTPGSVKTRLQQAGSQLQQAGSKLQQAGTRLIPDQARAALHDRLTRDRAH